MNFTWLIIMLINLGAGLVSTQSSHLDPMSAINFIGACFCAYMMGAESK